MAFDNKLEMLNSRYQLRSTIGQGGMGIVYQAEDRLTGQPVALKQMHLNPMVIGEDDSKVRRLQLAQEFQVLAGLRHPNVISVYDYGFDEKKQPYFTMSLLEKPQTLLEAAESQDLKGKTMLLVDLLQALAYLHQRGIIHRDLKPSNVLVDEKGVHVLDFGLAAERSAPGEIVGTLAYIAPEVLDGQPTTEKTDLYAIGVLAYEIYVGEHPYDVSSYQTLLAQVLYNDPDMSVLEAHPEIQVVVSRLLSKKPEDRYQTAESVIKALCHAVNQPVPGETVDIREGYLQSAKFVGRDKEMKMLIEAYEKAAGGAGSVWLVGGESGIGKSRLLDELRTRALVRGAIVLRGQAVEGGGLPYQLWREVLRRVALIANLTEQEASVFKEIIPEIDMLLDTSIPYPPSLAGEESRRRFASTIIDVLRRIPRPIVLMLEDLQWAVDSLVPLQGLIKLMPEANLLVVATYRSDENPVLHELLPGANHIQLQRLDNRSIAQLTSAMLGDAGMQPQVLDLVQRETEGNTYFIVEVVRALAESAGRLSDIGRVTLPQNVIAGGVQDVIRQRIDRVPQRYRGLLSLAAVAGRQTDNKLLEFLAEKYTINIEDWVTVCINAAVLEVHEGQWRFSHDKLRHYLLDAIPSLEKPVFHQQVAEAIEWVYLGDMNYAAQLQYHWQMARNPMKERYYAATAGGQMLATGNYLRARQLFERVLDLTPPSEGAQRGTALMTLTDITTHLSDYRAAEQYAAQALQTARQVNRVELEIQSILAQSTIIAHRFDFDQRLSLLKQAVELLPKANKASLEVQVLNAYGIALAQNMQADEARQYIEKAYQLAESLNEQLLHAECHIARGTLAQHQNDASTAQMHWYDALMLFESMGNYSRASDTRGKLGVLAIQQERYAVAAAHLELSLRTERDLVNPRAISERLIQLGYVYMNLDAPDTARSSFLQSLQQALEIDSPPLIVQALIGMAKLQLHLQTPHFAAEFIGLAQAHTEQNAALQKLIEEALQAVRELLDASSLQESLQTGKKMDMIALLADSLSQ